ncbi:MAG: hypothetical protein ACK5YL_00465, partial [Holosporales bacterium]
GKTAAAMGILAQVPTLLHGGDLNIGGPNKEERSKLNLQENAAQPTYQISSKNKTGKKDD